MTEIELTPGLNSPKCSFVRQRSALFLALAVVVLVVSAIGIAANRADSQNEEPGGLVFVIPAGASDTIDVPTIDSAIDIPIDIQFSPGDVARITIRNEDSVANRAGPWVVGAGQTYTARFDEPGIYQFDCTVNAAKSVTVTVNGGKEI